MSTLTLGLLSAASVNYIMFLTTRTLTGLALAGFTIIVLPLGEAGLEGGCWGAGRGEGGDGPIWPLLMVSLSPELEWLDVEHRTVAGVISSIFWTAGVLMLTLAGYLIRSWRWLLLAATLPCVPGIISIW